MFGLFSRKKKSYIAGIRTISIADLATLWRDSDEVLADDGKASDIKLEDTRGGKSKGKAADNGNDAWFDEKRFFPDLKKRLENFRTSAFRYKANAYYTLDTIAKELNQQRKVNNLEPLEPNDVIDFIHSNQILDSGKYMLRFDVGLPTKIYLYSHPCPANEKSVRNSPIVENGRRLKSIKLMKKT